MSEKIQATINPSSKITATTVGIHNINASSVGLGNVTNESKATMFTDPTFTGTVDTTTLNSSLVTISTTSEGNAENRLLRIKGPKPQLYFEDTDVNTTARAYTRFRRANDLFELSQVGHDYTTSATLTKIDLDNNGATKHHTYVGANRVGLFDQVGLSLGGNDSAGYLLDLRRHGTPSNTGNTLRIAQDNGGTAIRIGAGGTGDSVMTLLRVDGSGTNGKSGATDNAASGFSLKYDGTGSGAENKLVWYADNADSATAQSQVTAQTILNDGKVGIGTLTPTEALEVSGNLKVSQNITGASLTGQLFTSSQPFITGVGTISTGVWQGTPILEAYIGFLPTSKITSGTFANERISQSSVTQHQAALSIGASQLTGTIDDARLPSGIARDTELTAHTSLTNNPHNVTKAQVGLTNVEDKSSATIRSEIVDSDIPSTITRDSELSAHTSLTNNPHSVTAAQVNLGNVTNESKATMFTSPTFTGTVTVSGNIVPNANETLDIGTASSRFRDLFLSGDTLDLGGTKVKKNTDGDIEIRDASNNFKKVKASEIELEDSQDTANKVVFRMDSSGTPEFTKVNRTTLATVETDVKFTTLTMAKNITASTAPTSGDHLTNKTYVDAKVAGIVDSAPTALNTLNELAAALGDDANFATTTATSLGEKLVKSSNLSDLTNASTARTNLGLGNVEDTAISTFAGSSNITTVGTIGTGTWQGAAIANAYVADLPTSKITSGTFADARISSSSVTQHSGDITSVGTLTSLTTSGAVNVGSSPAYSQTRAVKIFDDGTAQAARVSLIGTGDSGQPALEFVTDGTLNKRTLIRHEADGASGDYGLNFFTSSGGTTAQKFRFAGNGNFGINTSSNSPAAKLHILQSSQDDHGGIKLEKSDGSNTWSIWQNSSSTLFFQNASTANGAPTTRAWLNTAGKLNVTGDLAVGGANVVVDSTSVAATQELKLDTATGQDNLISFKQAGGTGGSIRYVHGGSGSNMKFGIAGNDALTIAVTSISTDRPITSSGTIKSTSTISQPIQSDETNDTPINNISRLTQTQYNNLSGGPQANTLYIIV